MELHTYRDRRAPTSYPRASGGLAAGARQREACCKFLIFLGLEEALGKGDPWDELAWYPIVAVLAMKCARLRLGMWVPARNDLPDALDFGQAFVNG